MGGRVCPLSANTRVLFLSYSKRKWAKDPNNTAWSRNTDTFGQKILRQQGWAPGQYLGSQDASQTAHYTAASASHIRAVLKDDNLGLGARRNQGDECTGLDALQELLGRLNGKGEGELAKERRLREDARVNKYLNHKFGTIRFVHGGFLVGDKVQELADELQREKEAAAAAKAEAEASDAKEGKKEKKSKKRKSESDDDEDTATEKKKDKKSKKRKTEDAEDESKSKRKEKKEKKQKKDRKERNSEEMVESKTNDADEDAVDRKKSKKDKKEKRKKSKDDEDATPDADSDSQSRKKKKKSKAEKEDADDTASSAPATTASSTPGASGTSTPSSEVPHRHLARKRFIAQKRAAVMDPAALNQVRSHRSHEPSRSLWLILTCRSS